MKLFLFDLLPNFVVRSYQFFKWKQNKYAEPHPHFIKQQVLLNNNLTNSTWVETGTFRGETTLLLSKFARKVFSIEPAQVLYDRAVRKIKKPNIVFVNGTSENSFEPIVSRLMGNVCFWLDGHYSAADTFEGESHCPVLFELDVIDKYLINFDKCNILIDDVRCMNPVYDKDYPSINTLIEFANNRNLTWYIEKDILVIKK